MFTWSPQRNVVDIRTVICLITSLKLETNNKCANIFVLHTKVSSVCMQENIYIHRDVCITYYSLQMNLAVHGIESSYIFKTDFTE